MIEVFKTNITEESIALQLIRRIQHQFQGYYASFDLEDCDHILRIRSTRGLIDSFSVVELLHKSGYNAEILPE